LTAQCPQGFKSLQIKNITNLEFPSMKTLTPKLLAAVALGALVGAGCVTRPAEQSGTGGPGTPAQQQAAADAAAQQAAADEARRRALAEQAARENQRLVTEAQGLLSQARQYTGLNAEQSARLREAEAAMAAGDGRRAYDILNSLLSELKAARMAYAVVRGDSLWRIAGKSQVYGNPYQWPLIYKANNDKIKDADLIYPGQEFSIDKNPSQADAGAAVQHARTRGAWSVGAVEQTDKAYLAR
jgi:nucleoid-associated protein YgaU